MPYDIHVFSLSYSCCLHNSIVKSIFMKKNSKKMMNNFAVSRKIHTFALAFRNLIVG